MAEAMSEEQLAEIRAIADRDRWSTYCGHAGPRAIVTDLLDEVDRLRAQLAEIGETREEWQVVYLTHAQNMFYNGYTEPTRHEQSARSWMTDFLRNNPGRGATLMHRYRGEWREVEQESNHG